MKVILVNGSPHEHGCTATALGEVAKVLNASGIDTEVYWIGTDAVKGCLGCGFCRKNGRCVTEDCVNKFTELAKTADGFIFGTPVHYASASGTITAFWIARSTLHLLFLVENLLQLLQVAVAVVLLLHWIRLTNTSAFAVCLLYHHNTGIWFTATSPKRY